MHVDHLVWFDPDLASGSRYFAERMDHTPANGGIHPGEGTRNALLSLGARTYIEILGRDPDQPAASLDPELRQLTGSGFYHWAAGGADLNVVREKVLAAGLRGSDVITGGRTLPNGDRLRWKLFGVLGHEFGALVPFFIDWLDSLHPATTAPPGGSFSSLHAATPEAERLREIYRILDLDVEVTPSETTGFRATVKSGAGEHALHMFDPAPRGFVI